MAASLLCFGYWDCPAPDQQVLGLLGHDEAHCCAFRDALDEEDAFLPGAIARWARSAATPEAVRGIVQRAHQAGAPGGRFDEVEIARATLPADNLTGPVVIALYARRRNGAIHYRRTGAAPGQPIPFTTCPLAPATAHGLVCGHPDIIAMNGLDLLLWSLPVKSPTPSAVAERVRESSATWMPSAWSPFHDFSHIEEEIRRTVVAGMLARLGSVPPGGDVQ